MLETFIANNSSAFATGTEPAPSKSVGVVRSTISASMPELANSRSTLTPDGDIRLHAVPPSHVAAATPNYPVEI
jgi:hypothetical protein